MAGAMYIWIVGAVFASVVGVMLLLMAAFRIGHWLEKKSTGAKHGFLEVPEGARSRPAPRAADLPDSASKKHTSPAAPTAGTD